MGGETAPHDYSVLRIPHFQLALAEFPDHVAGIILVSGRNPIVPGDIQQALADGHGPAGMIYAAAHRQGAALQLHIALDVQISVHRQIVARQVQGTFLNPKIAVDRPILRHRPGLFDMPEPIRFGNILQNRLDAAEIRRDQVRFRRLGRHQLHHQGRFRGDIIQINILRRRYFVFRSGAEIALLLLQIRFHLIVRGILDAPEQLVDCPLFVGLLEVVQIGMDPLSVHLVKHLQACGVKPGVLYRRVLTEGPLPTLHLIPDRRFQMEQGIQLIEGCVALAGVEQGIGQKFPSGLSCGQAQADKVAFCADRGGQHGRALFQSQHGSVRAQRNGGLVHL